MKIRNEPPIIITEDERGMFDYTIKFIKQTLSL